MTVIRGHLTPAPPTGTYLGMSTSPKAARGALHNRQLRRNLKHATTVIHSKRAIRASEVRNQEELRVADEQVRNRLGRHLDQYLIQAEKAMTAAGITVHWVRNAEEADKIAIDLTRSRDTNEVVRVKSMATQEIDLSEALEDAGIATWGADLAELVVQLGHDRPSHILVPTIHRSRSEVREIFKEEMGLWGAPVPDGISDNPPELAGMVHIHLREKFLRVKVAVSGDNFIIAGTDPLMIVEFEGNGRMCLTLPETLISVVGIEKLVPTWEDLKVFLRLLSRSSVGERMNPYTPIWTSVTPDDGLQDLRVALLDNDHTKMLSGLVSREALRCIRCSAYMNVCPVYERVGGHTYGSIYPRPIGAILTPRLRRVAPKVDKPLPCASSLCGTCNDMCPVKIPISDILVHMHNKAVQEKTTHRPTIESVIFKLVGWIMARGHNLTFIQFFSRLAGRIFKKRTHFGPMPSPASAWSRSRGLPVPPKESFRRWQAKQEEEGASK